MSKQSEAMLRTKWSPRLTETALVNESEMRRTAFYIINQRDIIGKTMQQWHDEMLKVSAFLDGNLSAAGFGPKTEAGQKMAEVYDELRVQNIVWDALHDHAQLAAESRPGVRVPTIGAGVKPQDAAD